MAIRQIVITINRDGTSTVDAQNFAGVGCAAATKAIEVALGGDDASNVDDKKKPDFYATNNNFTTQKH